jgi:hypothetical protein
VRYSVSLVGLPLGFAGLNANLKPDAYGVEVTAKLTGLASVISSARGGATATGNIANARLWPATYATTSSNTKETHTVRMAMANGTVRGVEVIPPIDDSPERVPVTDAHRHGIIDPLSALIMPVGPAQSLVGPAACNRSLPIFDGYTRFDVNLTFVGLRNVRIKGYTGPVSVCAARYVPIAGHKPNRVATQFMADNRDMEVWLAPVVSAHVELPVRISVKTLVGTTVIEAQDVVVDGPGEPAPAPAQD